MLAEEAVGQAAVDVGSEVVALKGCSASTPDACPPCHPPCQQLHLACEAGAPKRIFLPMSVMVPASSGSARWHFQLLLVHPLLDPQARCLRASTCQRPADLKSQWPLKSRYAKWSASSRDRLPDRLGDSATSSALPELGVTTSCDVHVAARNFSCPWREWGTEI